MVRAFVFVIHVIMVHMNGSIALCFTLTYIWTELSALLLRFEFVQLISELIVKNDHMLNAFYQFVLVQCLQMVLVFRGMGCGSSLRFGGFGLMGFDDHVVIVVYVCV